MIHVAELNNENICVGVKTVITMIDDGRHIEVDSLSDDYIYRKYENGEWSEEKYVPDHAQIELTRMEQLEQSQADQDEVIMQLLLGGA